MSITPIVRGLYLCEQVDVHASLNLTLRNCFRTLRVAGLPIAARPFFVVVYLANGLGRVKATIQVRRLDTLDLIYTADAPLTFPDRLQEVRFKAWIGQCVFPGPGRFEVLFWSDGNLLAQTPFTVRSLEEASS